MNYNAMPDTRIIDQTAEALRERGMEVFVVADRAAARGHHGRAWLLAWESCGQLQSTNERRSVADDATICSWSHLSNQHRRQWNLR